MRTVLTILMTLSAGPALAHIGHLGEVAGHGHWLGAAAIGAAIAIGLWQGLKGKAEAEAEDDAEEIGEEELQDA
ncbi:DUF6732 family protein [Pseudooceanicola sp. MF1-13]|uniref:DUF6732 family protein n=1 Tax=Pseudooceanicola sp. MF1-13 TaxID=3379095 RepID=UPI003891D3D2